MKKFILPVIAAVLVVTAAIVLIVVPKGGAASNTADAYIETKTTGDAVEILASQLQPDKITLFQVAEGSKVELIAIQGADGKAKVALATCQSCNGSPGAYYTQKGDKLQCNNCGLTFPLSVIGEEGTGCHPILLDKAQVTEIDGGVSIDRSYLLSLEPLFKNIAKHG